ncbi:MAG TPA: glutamate--tRNA ligase [Pseudobdellovibrionaceae bacterium]|nr:glutamate--tRNA ligase [Pseudobdellovibrionaceae bacterium]
MSWRQISPEVRTRFAPSPTGYLHVGGARTALYNYLYAKKNGGKFILRIEDTDQARSTEDSLKMVIGDLLWLNLLWDEGPDAKTLEDAGPHAPYRQSRRQEIYRQVADQLLTEGKAYYCFLTDAELEAQREAALAAGRPPHVVSPYADWPLEKALEKKAAGDKGVVRFKTKGLAKDYVLNDLVRNEVRFPSDMVGDFVLLRSDGMPVYNFCCVVDDHLMRITHVLRAEEHLPNTLRQMMIYEAMNWPLPEFGHISLVLDEDRQKLSKRKGAVACNQFKEEGYLADALKNFIALLGWSHPEGKEIISPEEMIEAFSLDRLNPAGAVFDRVKLKWMNAMHLRALPDEELWEKTEPFLTAAGLDFSGMDPVWKSKSLAAFKTAMEILSDAVPLYALLDDERFGVSPEASETLGWEPTKLVLSVWRDLIAAHPRDEFTEEEFVKIQDEVKTKANVKGKNLFMPIRVAVIGKPHGTELKTLVPLMKKTSLLKRAERVLAALP